MRDFKHSLPMELMRAREAAMSRFRPMLRDHGLTEQQWRVIRALVDAGGADVGELARKSCLLAPSLTRILQHLESRSLIKRTQNSTDNRRAIISLTARGRRLFNKIGPRLESLYSVIEDEFGIERLEALYTLLAEFYETLQANQ